MIGEFIQCIQESMLISILAKFERYLFLSYYECEHYE